MAEAAAFSCIDVARVIVLEILGKMCLKRMEEWDQEMPIEERTVWRQCKAFIVHIVNTFCAIVIMVGYEAFSQKAEWLVDPPVCFSQSCSGDVEMHIW
eukprot:CAMPEP_0206261870 /NCGR_PEP_ID=MMETSP0047_2-20121206/27907_1 /ASSEMBLY_ACC=CAM_ASM_000192 /TAXON_ID=195065 /ORGANISM="Chroomonas mesostigmatica_cf, Strain CCMP1168" /LENGTH=97 /DNA_ID=CAMNT_0053689157 /DNA_START=86 /DNA_END=376 /DNA_ORIENTATION=-